MTDTMIITISNNEEGELMNKEIKFEESISEAIVSTLKNIYKLANEGTPYSMPPMRNEFDDVTTKWDHFAFVSTFESLSKEERTYRGRILDIFEHKVITKKDKKELFVLKNMLTKTYRYMKSIAKTHSLEKTQIELLEEESMPVQTESSTDTDLVEEPVGQEVQQETQEVDTEQNSADYQDAEKITAEQEQEQQLTEQPVEFVTNAVEEQTIDSEESTDQATEKESAGTKIQVGLLSEDQAVYRINSNGRKVILNYPENKKVAADVKANPDNYVVTMCDRKGNPTEQTIDSATTQRQKPSMIVDDNVEVQPKAVIEQVQLEPDHKYNKIVTVGTDTMSPWGVAGDYSDFLANAKDKTIGEYLRFAITAGAIPQDKLEKIQQIIDTYGDLTKEQYDVQMAITAAQEHEYNEKDNVNDIDVF